VGAQPPRSCIHVLAQSASHVHVRNHIQSQDCSPSLHTEVLQHCRAVYNVQPRNLLVNSAIHWTSSNQGLSGTRCALYVRALRHPLSSQCLPPHSTSAHYQGSQSEVLCSFWWQRSLLVCLAHLQGLSCDTQPRNLLGIAQTSAEDDKKHDQEMVVVEGYVESIDKLHHTFDIRVRVDVPGLPSCSTFTSPRLRQCHIVSVSEREQVNSSSVG
jgi:hypothetical protein